jgi:hypothetical protein
VTFSVVLLLLLPCFSRAFTSLSLTSTHTSSRRSSAVPIRPPRQSSTCLESGSMLEFAMFGGLAPKKGRKGRFSSGGKGKKKSNKNSMALEASFPPGVGEGEGDTVDRNKGNEEKAKGCRENSVSNSNPEVDEDETSRLTRIKTKARSIFHTIRQAPLWPELICFGLGYLLRDQKMTTAATVAATSTNTLLRRLLKRLLKRRLPRPPWP